MKTTAETLEKLLNSYPSDANIFRTSIEKSDGGLRPIVKPNKVLRFWLRQVLRALRGARKDWPVFIHGGVRKRSYVSFVKPHTSKKLVVTIDIRNCFGSITRKQIVDVLVTKLELPHNLAKQMSAQLCVDGKIPQGFATSNFLTNLYLNDALLAINRKLARKGISMTIYVDDIAMSGNDFDPAEAINIACEELSHAKLAIKKAKVKVMRSNTRQVIVGLVVNRGVAISKEKRKEIFSLVSSRSMSEESLGGWMSNLNMFDKPLMRKLRSFAMRKGYSIPEKK